MQDLHRRKENDRMWDDFFEKFGTPKEERDQFIKNINKRKPKEELKIYCHSVEEYERYKNHLEKILGK